MPLTPSSMLPLGTSAPDFRLPDTDGSMVRRDDFKGGKGLVVMFICNHCPYVIHLRTELAKFGRECQGNGLGVVGISSNNVMTHPADSPEKMKEERIRAGYSFPYLYDESQAVAKAYQAACTPDFYLFDGQFNLAYRGRFDGATPGNAVPVTGGDLRSACEALLTGRPVSPDQKPSMGCNIKWK